MSERGREGEGKGERGMERERGVWKGSESRDERREPMNVYGDVSNALQTFSRMFGVECAATPRLCEDVSWPGLAREKEKVTVVSAILICICVCVQWRTL